MGELEREVERTIQDSLSALGRDDLFRQAIVGASSADDPLYRELKEIVGPWHLAPREILPEARTVVSYVVPFTRRVAASPVGDDDTSLWGEAYVAINDRFPVIDEAVCRLLRSRGWAACPVPQDAYQSDGEDDRASWARPPRNAWSHRSGAAVAGLGTFGLNRLLIGPKGSAVRHSTVFTSAELSFPAPELVARCPATHGGKCGACVAACPTGALTPKSLDYARCSRRCIEMEEVLGRAGATVCGRCIAACPVAYIE